MKIGFGGRSMSTDRFDASLAFTLEVCIVLLPLIASEVEWFHEVTSQQYRCFIRGDDPEACV
jgi:hypothetical protein